MRGSHPRQWQYQWFAHMSCNDWDTCRGIPDAVNRINGGANGGYQSGNAIATRIAVTASTIAAAISSSLADFLSAVTPSS